jgi:carbamoyl-phosphate synthase large subunit
MNVLITSVARKVWLVEAFRRAVGPLGGRVLAADTDPFAVGLRLADGSVDLPRQDGPGFEAALLAACVVHGIRLIVPTRDGELAWFADRRARLAEAGVVVMVAGPAVIELCQDKRAFAEHCLAAGFAVAEIAPSREAVRLPAFARPRRGAGGRGAGRIDDRAALARLDPWDDWVVQPLVEAPEYTIDLFADFSGAVLSVAPRQRLRVVAGESVVGVTVEAPRLVERSADLARSLGLVGHNTLQAFWDVGEPLWIEVNPRYGGGAALGFAAGADTPAMLVKLAAGQPVAPRIGDYERGLYLYRYSADHFTRDAA